MSDIIENTSRPVDPHEKGWYWIKDTRGAREVYCSLLDTGCMFCSSRQYIKATIPDFPGDKSLPPTWQRIRVYEQFLSWGIRLPDGYWLLDDGNRLADKYVEPVDELAREALFRPDNGR